MKSRARRSFQRNLERLSPELQLEARAAYRTFETDPFHPGLQFKLVNQRRGIWSVRVGLHIRALGVRSGEDIDRYWIGGHDDYDRLI